MKDTLAELLKAVNFHNRYARLQKRYEGGTPMSRYHPEEFHHQVERLGYEPDYRPREGFYRFVDDVDDARIQMNVSFPQARVEFTLFVQDGGRGRADGGPWHMLARMLDKDGKTYQGIRFSSPQEVRAILEEALSIYEDLKQALADRD